MGAQQGIFRRKGYKILSCGFLQQNEVGSRADERCRNSIMRFPRMADYLATKYSIVPISIFETNIEKTLSETKVKRANPFRGHPYERDFFEIDGVRVTFKIPFDGEPDLFELQPGSRILLRFATQSFVSPHDEECGSFTLDFEYTKQELQDKGEAMAEYVQKQFENEFRNYKTMIDNVNAEVTSFNNGLVASAMRLLEERKRSSPRSISTA